MRQVISEVARAEPWRCPAGESGDAAKNLRWLDRREAREDWALFGRLQSTHTRPTPPIVQFQAFLGGLY